MKLKLMVYEKGKCLKTARNYHWKKVVLVIKWEVQQWVSVNYYQRKSSDFVEEDKSDYKISPRNQ